MILIVLIFQVLVVFIARGYEDYLNVFNVKQLNAPRFILRTNKKDTVNVVSFLYQIVNLIMVFCFVVLQIIEIFIGKSIQLQVWINGFLIVYFDFLTLCLISVVILFVLSIKKRRELKLREERQLLG